MWVKILREGMIKTKDDLIAAQKTAFGWVIFKREAESSPCRKLTFHVTKNSNENNFVDLTSLIESFWKVESIPSAPTLTPPVGVREFLR